MKPNNHQSSGRRTRLHIQPLEERALPATSQVFANGVLTVVGTAQKDNITLYQVAGEVYVTDRLIKDGSRLTNSIEASRITKIRIFGGGGDDIIYFRQGPYDGNYNWDDFSIPVLAYGEAGNDEITGGLGDDTLIGGYGNDTLYGVAGSDTLAGSQGNDTLHAESEFPSTAPNLLQGGSGNDYLFGGRGADRLEGGTGNDYLDANESGAKELRGDDGNDTIYGSHSGDTIYGGRGNDYLDMGNGSDSIFAGDGNDTIYAGEGNDRLVGEAGFDRLYGEEGEDILVITIGEDYGNPGSGNDRVQATFDWDAFRKSKGAQSLYNPLNDYNAGIDRYELSLKTGALATDLLNHWVSKIRSITGQLQPLLRFLDQRVPGIPKDLSNWTVADYLLEIRPDYKDQYETFRDAIAVINSLPKLSFKSTIDLGAFEVGYGSISDLEFDNPFAGLSIDKLLQKFNALGAISPFLNQHTSLLDLAFGRNVTLFQFDLPRFDVEFTVSEANYIPSGVWFVNLYYSGAVTIDMYARASFGCDTSGLYNGRPIDGFYVDDVYVGIDLGGEFEGGASIGVGNYSIFSFGFGGSMSGYVWMELKGPNDETRIYFNDLRYINKVKLASGPIKANLYTYYRYGIPNVWQREKRIPLASALITF